jgi:hypothetical protein
LILDKREIVEIKNPTNNDVADGGMRVWHFNGVITTYGKRDCRNSWRYASLAVNRGAIKWGFTVYTFLIIEWTNPNPKL